MSFLNRKSSRALATAVLLSLFFGQISFAARISDAAGNAAQSNDQTFRTSQAGVDSINITRSDYVKVSRGVFRIVIEATSSQARNGKTELSFLILDKKSRKIAVGSLLFNNNDGVYRATLTVGSKPKKWVVGVRSTLGGSAGQRITKY